MFVPLLEPSRYRGAWGGRGSGKSEFFAGLVVEQALLWPEAAGEGLRLVCIREVQRSLKHSAKALIERKIRQFGLEGPGRFKITADTIATPRDGVILFQGMQDHTADSIKSLDGFHVAWVEEAQSLSALSLSLLRPTIRWESRSRGLSSELWFSWNPRRRTDAVDALLRGDPPPGATVVRANWSDNPWFPAVLEQERQDCLRMQPDQYRHIWEGDYATVLTGAYYARELDAARREGRITRVSRDPLMSVRAVWDIGGTGDRADACAIWIVQFVGREVRFLDYYEAQGQPLAAHVEWLRRRGWGAAICILPHDGATQDRVHAVSFESALRQAGFEVSVVRNQGRGAAMQRIEAARRLFPAMWFNEETCSAGLDALGWYHERRDDARGIGLGPEHDWSSHAADAFGLAAVAYEAPSPRPSLPKFVPVPVV